MLSIKQKQVIGVTTLVVLVAMSLSAVDLALLTETLFQQSRERGEAIAELIASSATDPSLSAPDQTALQRLRGPEVRTALASGVHFRDVVYAAIVDTSGTIVAHYDDSRLGQRLPDADDLAAVADAGVIAQFRAVYQTQRILEWRIPLYAGDAPFAEIRVGLSTLLIRQTLNDTLGPAAVSAAVALVVALIVAVLLSQIIVRPIHVIRSGLSRLGRGDLGATLDLQGEEFKELGDVFASLTTQLRAAIPDRDKRDQLLELSRRVTALGRLTAGVAHEVKNPLNAMTIHLELLKQKLAAGAGVDQTGSHVDVIAREIRRLDAVVQDFLKFARPEELSLQAVSPAAIIDEVIKTLAVEADVTGVRLETSVSPEVADIEADPGILRQALLNLARNAVQAMPGGGTLRMTASAMRDGRVELRVADTGVGIPPEHLARIFDLYFTTKEAGTGIGLSLVYRTVQLHNGDIAVESTPGVGTTFIIRLPRARSSAEPPRPAEARQSS